MRKMLLRLIQKYFLKVDTNIMPGDLICPVNNEKTVFEALGIYYSYQLKPFLFFRDVNGPQIYSAPIFEYKRAPIVTNGDFPVF